VGAAVVASALAAVEVVAGVVAAAMAADDGPNSTSKAKEATNNAVPVTMANPPSLCTTDRSISRDWDKVATSPL
jgi:hypothetical protein